MPFITVEAGLLTKDQKVSLAKNLTKTAAEVMKLPEDGVGAAQIPVAWAIAKGMLPIIGVTKENQVEDPMT